jgi:Ras-related protein Rab-1A
MNGNESIKYKIALLGDSMVGKTSIFKKLFTSKFNEKAICTVGVDVKTIVFEDVEVNANGNGENKCFEIIIFDTAGQERFASLPLSYIRGCDGIFIIYDITNKKSFDHVENWSKSIADIISNYNSQNYLVMLLGNKLDLANDNKESRKVYAEEGEEVCKKYNFDWGGECSAKDFTSQQFKDLIQNFAKKIYSNVAKQDNTRITVTKQNNLKKNKKKFC